MGAFGCMFVHRIKTSVSPMRASMGVEAGWTISKAGLSAVFDVGCSYDGEMVAMVSLCFLESRVQRLLAQSRCSTAP